MASVEESADESCRQPFPTGRLLAGSLAFVLAAVLAVVCTYEKDVVPRGLGFMPADVALGLPKTLLGRHELAPIQTTVSLNVLPGVSGCNPTDVEATFTPISARGTALHRSDGSERAIGLVILGRDLRHIRINLARSETASNKLLPVGRPAADGATLERIETLPYKGQGALYRLRLRSWPRSTTPLVVRFSADWATFRSIGSCFVRLPALTTSFGTWAATAAIGGERPADERGRASRGTVFFGPGSGTIDAERSTRKPKEYVIGLESWECTAPRNSLTEFMADVNARRPVSCEADVVIQSLGWRTFRSVSLFLLGILAALAAQLLYDGFTAAHRSRQWTRARITALAMLATYTALLVWLFVQYLDLDTNPLLYGTGLASSLAIGFLMPARWPLGIPRWLR